MPKDEVALKDDQESEEAKTAADAETNLESADAADTETSTKRKFKDQGKSRFIAFVGTSSPPPLHHPH